MTILRKDRLTIKALPGDEVRFRQTLVDAHGSQWSEVKPFYPNAFGIQKQDKSYFYDKEYEKKRIVIHATHGYTSGDVANLSKRHVSTAYLISRDGTVYELFHPAKWSYHIGSVPSDYWCTNTSESRETIAIELSNIGDLREHNRKPDILLDAWGFPYCMKENAEYYKEVSYRGHDYYATYTDKQYKALDSLLLFLCRSFGIVHSFLPVDERMSYIDYEPKAGILTHVNYRKDKVDVNPTFDWLKVSGR